MVHVVFMAVVYGVLFLGQVEIGFSMDNGSYVKGIVSFHGKIPRTETKQIQIDMAVCGNVAQLSGVQVETRVRGLQDVVVSVQGVSSLVRATASPTERLVENVNCTFKPEVLAARQGETLAIHNRDPILHNTHITAGKRTVVNVAQVAGSRPILKKLKYTGSHVIRCDKHTFMRATLQVFAHPYFSVTDELGAFHIPNLPAGTYTMVVWHATLGNLQREITIPAHGGLTVNFAYP